MEKRISLFGLVARDTPWMFRTRSDREFEFEPDTLLEVTSPPKKYYGSSGMYVGFRVVGGTREYFTTFKNFMTCTDLLD